MCNLLWMFIQAPVMFCLPWSIVFTLKCIHTFFFVCYTKAYCLQVDHQSPQNRNHCLRAIVVWSFETMLLGVLWETYDMDAACYDIVVCEILWYYMHPMYTLHISFRMSCSSSKFGFCSANAITKSHATLLCYVNCNIAQMQNMDFHETFAKKFKLEQ